MLETLLCKRQNERKQCQNEHAERHHIFEIKMITIHQHHPHPMYNQIEVNTPCNTVAGFHHITSGISLQ